MTDDRCMKCGHLPVYHGASWCVYQAGSTRKRDCDCDGWAAASAGADPEPPAIYLPMDCPVCGRHRVEWDGQTLRCEKCTTSSEWDGFSKERYEGAAPRYPDGCTTDTEHYRHKQRGLPRPEASE